MSRQEMVNAIDRVVEVVSGDAKDLGLSPTDTQVSGLRVRLFREVADWTEGMWAPENTPARIATEPRYECTLGSCEGGDNIHAENDLYHVPYQVKEDEVYPAGWYCDYCIRNEVGDHLTDVERGQLVCLADELRRRAEEGLAA